MTEARIVEPSVKNEASMAILASTAALTACGGGGSSGPNVAPDNSSGTNNGNTPGNANTLAAQIDASRFLRQASWGGTTSEIKEVAALGPAVWLDAQMNQALSNNMTRWLITKGFNDSAINSNVNWEGGWV